MRERTVRDCHHLSRRFLILAAVLLLCPAGGCAVWDRDFWNLNALRDERAVEIDHRLDNAESPVKSPF
jgi:hypothetical protein